jgi:hypothetical protein
LTFSTASTASADSTTSTRSTPLDPPPGYKSHSESETGFVRWTDQDRLRDVLATADSTRAISSGAASLPIG